MVERVLVVRTDELKQRLPVQRFKALPAEEIERLHASVEVLALDRDLAERDPGFKQLVACSAVHHNYTWLTHAHDGRGVLPAKSGGRSLLINQHLRADGQVPLFLDEQLAAGAACAVAAAVVIPDRFHLRLAGLIDDDRDEYSRSHLGLVYVVHLTRPGVARREDGIDGIACCGMGELQQLRDQFEPWSQILIDHLDAL